MIYKFGTRWYIYRNEADYPDNPLVKNGFSSRKLASIYLELHRKELGF